MAYQTRGREPLLDKEMAEAIERRSKELIGIESVKPSTLRRFVTTLWSRMGA